jgi:protein-tyrosine phosphatase
MILKNIIIVIAIITVLLASVFAWARYTQSLLVLDMRNVFELPKHFRATSPLPAVNNMNLTGLSDLHIAGGAQFSKAALQRILQHLETKKLVIIDLREESHGFVNGNAISWYGKAAADNAGKTPQQIEKLQATLLGEISKMKNVTVNRILKKTPDEYIAKTKPIEFAVHGTSSEAELAERMHLTYRRIYVEDYHAPEPDQVDRFIKITTQLPPDKWIYFHCKAGIGRTTTFMVMYDMMHNAKTVSFDDILARQQAIGGKGLTEMPDQRRYKYKYAVERLQFLKRFYEYSRDNNDNFQTSWTAWQKQYL